MQEGAGPRPFDVATRRLIEEVPSSWLRLAGLPVNGPVHTVEFDVSTVPAEVDKLLRVEADEPWLAHLEVQTTHDVRLPSRMLQYHALLRHRYATPVESTVVLLRREADDPELSGRLDLPGSTGELTVSFRFRVVRVWELPVETLLMGGLGMLPLAPLADITQDRLPEIIQRIDHQIDPTLPGATTEEIWSAILLLTGLRYDQSVMRELVRRFPNMRESAAYQMILEAGREEGREQGELRHARQMLRELSADKFGQPDAMTATRVASIEDIAMLNRLIHGILRAASWQELLNMADDQ